MQIVCLFYSLYDNNAIFSKALLQPFSIIRKLHRNRCNNYAKSLNVLHVQKTFHPFFESEESGFQNNLRKMHQTILAFASIVAQLLFAKKVHSEHLPNKSSTFKITSHFTRYPIMTSQIDNTYSLKISNIWKLTS